MEFIVNAMQDTRRNQYEWRVCEWECECLRRKNSFFFIYFDFCMYFMCKLTTKPRRWTKTNVEPTNILYFNFVQHFMESQSIELLYAKFISCRTQTETSNTCASTYHLIICVWLLVSYINRNEWEYEKYFNPFHCQETWLWRMYVVVGMEWQLLLLFPLHD